MFKTGLLVVSNPMQINKILSTIRQQVNNVLYIQLLSALSEPFGTFYPSLFTSCPKYNQTIIKIYSQVVSECEHLDVRVLLSGLKYQVSKIQTQNPIDLVIFDKKYNQIEVDSFLKDRIGNVNKSCGVLTYESGSFVDPPIGSNDRIYKHAVLGGTFDRLHVAHKILLSEMALRCSQKVTVGVTEENMLESKLLWELVEPINKRITNVKSFLEDICSELEVDVVPINDPFGPTQHDPTMELLVVSSETLKGGEKVNAIRTSKNLPPVDVLSVELIDEPHPDAHEEKKLSSSTGRLRLLGTLLKPLEVKNIPNTPYVIGLTGGIASGKSGVARWMENLGAEIINCDLLAHDLYKPGAKCYQALLGEFGSEIIGENSQIDRKKLGGIVFNDSSKMNKLNSIVWPALAEEVSAITRKSKSQVVVVEAAILFTAGWEKFCHEVWTTLVPRSEAIHRLKTRNMLTEEQAIARIESQPKNKFYVENSNVIFCTLWEPEYTRQQVEKAWKLLNERKPKTSELNVST